jgi:uncharacterized protein involved in cysteine biosynthesis
MATRQAVGFWRGFSSLFGAMGWLLSRPGAWPYALVPALVFAVLEASFAVAAFYLLLPYARVELAHGELMPTWGEKLASFGVFGLSLVLGWFLSLSLAPILSAPALERLVGKAERELGAAPRQELGFFQELWCGLGAFVVGASVVLPLVFLLFLLDFVPGATVVVTPLKLVLGALGVAWGLFDYPLTLRGIRARDRFLFMRQHLSAVLGFGAAFSLLFWLPCLGLLILPVGVIAATQLYWQIQRAPAC